MASHNFKGPSPRFSRRDVLKIAVATVGCGALALAEWRFSFLRRLAGLGGPAIPDYRLTYLPPTTSLSAAPNSTSTPESTTTPKSTPTPEFPRLLATEVASYANAIGYSDVDVINRVEISDLVDPQGRQFQAAVDPETSIPLLVTNERGLWQRASLRNLADKSGINVGVLYDSNARFDLGTEFNYGLISSSWGGTIESSGLRDDFTFDDEDNRIRAARLLGIDNFRLMHLIAAHRQELPDWLREGSFSRGELIQILIGYITTVMNHFKGVIGEYVVVNEPYMVGVDPMIDDPFLETIGKDYIDIAFQAARDADPSAKLMLNTWGNQWSGGPYTTLTRDLAARLATKGLIDKVGLQMHIDNTSMRASPDNVERTIRGYGLPVAFTEFDVDLRDEGGTQKERFALQAQVYENMIGAALRSGLVKDIGFWGYGDNQSWLENPAEPGTSPDANPTMWDNELKPKPAYYAVRKVLLAEARQYKIYTAQKMATHRL